MMSMIMIMVMMMKEITVITGHQDGTHYNQEVLITTPTRAV